MSDAEWQEYWSALETNSEIRVRFKGERGKARIWRDGTALRCRLYDVEQEVELVPYSRIQRFQPAGIGSAGLATGVENSTSLNQPSSSTDTNEEPVVDVEPVTASATFMMQLIAGGVADHHAIRITQQLYSRREHMKPISAAIRERIIEQWRGVP